MKLVDKDNKILKTECDEHILSEYSEQLSYDMIIAMKEHDAIGLAAPQVGENTRLMIIGHEDNGFVVCINPEWEVAEDSEDEDFLEGCVSFAGLELTINRPNKINTPPIVGVPIFFIIWSLGPSSLIGSKN